MTGTLAKQSVVRTRRASSSAVLLAFFLLKPRWQLGRSSDPRCLDSTAGVSYATVVWFLYGLWSVYIEEAACARLATEPQVIRVSGLLREAVHRIVAWGRGPRSESEHRLGNVLIDEIAMLPPEPLSLAYPNDFRLRQITDGILSNLADERGMEDWARLAGITTRTLARRFVAETGFGFSEWRQRAKVLRAIELLAENMPVTTIAVDLGYTNVSAFIAMFTRILGTTPGCYARSQLERSGRSIPGH